MKYFYITNLQGDVVGIANENGIVGYYEYDAWENKPSYYAVKNSGARDSYAIISFKTDVKFVKDDGVKHPMAGAYNPVVSIHPGPIKVWDVKIVEVYKK